MISQEKINCGGSKLEITRALLEAEVDIPIPCSVWKYYDQSLDSVKSEFEKMRKPVIVRGSHMNDYHGFIDVVPTVRNVKTFSKLEKAVKNIEKEMLTKDVKNHCDDWDQPYSPEVHVLIQEQTSDFVGTMMKHPHTGVYYLQIVRDIEEYNRIHDTPTVELFMKDGECIINTSKDCISDKEAEEIFNLYDKLYETGVIDNSYSQKVEIGLKPLMFFQANPFKKFQEKANFEIVNYMDLDCQYIVPFVSFGITPEGGIDIEMVEINKKDMGKNKFELSKKKKSIILRDIMRWSYKKGFKFGDLECYCSPSFESNFLAHSDYRFMKKSDFSLICNEYLISRLEPVEHFKESKLFSNGEDSIIIPKEYL